MKKLTLLLVLFSYAVASFAQFTVSENGYSVSSNFTIDGVFGGAVKSGVFNVNAKTLDSKYNSFSNPNPLLIRTDCSGYTTIFPYSNYCQDKLNFYVKANGQLYASGGIVQSAASQSAGRSARSSSLTSSLGKLESLNAVVYQPAQSENGSMSRSINSSEEPDAALETALSPVAQAMAQEESLGRFGLLASEVETVFPEVVRTLPDGSKGIMYTDLVPVLIESIKELRAELNQVKTLLAGGNAPQLAPDGTASAAPAAAAAQNGAELFQNTPNPFDQATEITYRLPANIATASICIYDLNGQQVKIYPLLTGSSVGTLTLSASELSPGIYLYALVIDGRVADSKRMTLTE